MDILIRLSDADRSRGIDVHHVRAHMDQVLLRDCETCTVDDGREVFVIKSRDGRASEFDVI